MSFTAKLKRGYKWYLYRNVDGNLPIAITSDPVKMGDVSFYLDYLKGKDEKSVNNQIIKLRNMERGGKVKSVECRELKELMENPPETKKKPKKESEE
jgi:hypothetical protein